MLDTEYNRKISQQIHEINKDFIKHSKKVNRMGGGLLNVAETDKSALGRPVGGSFFGDLIKGVGAILGGEKPEVDEKFDEMPIEGGKKKRTYKKKKGGNFLKDLVSTVATVAPLIALGKPEKKGKKASKAGKKVNPWVEHVKAYAKKHNMKYNDALKVAKDTYQK